MISNIISFVCTMLFSLSGVLWDLRPLPASHSWAKLPQHQTISNIRTSHVIHMWFTWFTAQLWGFGLIVSAVSDIGKHGKLCVLSRHWNAACKNDLVIGLAKWRPQKVGPEWLGSSLPPHAWRKRAKRICSRTCFTWSAFRGTNLDHSWSFLNLQRCKPTWHVRDVKHCIANGSRISMLSSFTVFHSLCFVFLLSLFCLCCVSIYFVSFLKLPLDVSFCLQKEVFVWAQSSRGQNLREPR